MEEHVDPVGAAGALAQPFIAQCRREIAAAWIHIEAAKEMLKRGRWLLARWAEQRQLLEATESARLAAADRSEAARIGMFVGLEPASRRRRGTVSSIMPRAAFHTRRRSASG
jgi:hypothetical protein